jgi:adenylate kinase family enzyme
MKSFKDYAGIREESSPDYDLLLTEGINDPGIFKAVFMAGGPGSGKSFISGKTGLTSMGLRVINSDDIFEAQLEKAGMKATPENIWSDKGQVIRVGAKALTKKKQEISIDGRLGLLIDGTGKDVAKIKKQKAGLERLGYDTMMIFVNTTLDTSVSRDKLRDRSVGKEKVTQMWSGVQENIGAFQRMFGAKGFIVVDNTEGKDFKKETLVAYRVASKFITAEPENRLAKKWIDAERKNRGIKTLKPAKRKN